MARRLRDKHDLRRTRGTRRERPRVLVVVEGVRTEVEYFRGLANHLRASAVSVVDVKVRGVGGKPGDLLDAARVETDGGESIGSPDGYDAAWCVFDVDEHLRIPEIVAAARRAGIRTAISNPCFEVWLLWHFREYSRHTDSKTLKRELRKHGFHGDCKSVPARFDFSLAERAHERALPAAHRDLPENPGSGVALLYAALRGDVD
ncbi:RloB family protein [Saccharomonospora iraqiensis]|uniref:RloB family protein n=1 Tax=Saccharomonospora iraqiensis TaxID=52698 RepID=UPI00022E7BE8|nr:RloB family protein [Saccharomonospora iraqiensis]